MRDLHVRESIFEADALVDFEPMERFENRKDVTGSRSKDCSAGQVVLDSLKARSLSNCSN